LHIEEFDAHLIVHKNHDIVCVWKIAKVYGIAVFMSLVLRGLIFIFVSHIQTW